MRCLNLSNPFRSGSIPVGFRGYCRKCSQPFYGPFNFNICEKCWLKRRDALGEPTQANSGHNAVILVYAGQPLRFISIHGHPAYEICTADLATTFDTSEDALRISQEHNIPQKHLTIEPLTKHL